MRASWRAPRGRVAAAVAEILQTAAIAGGLAVALPAPCSAQGPQASRLTADIPAQPLAAALNALAGQTGLQLVYVSGIVRSQTSRAVPAGLEAHDALTRMLEGSGLHPQFLTAQSVRILAAANEAPAASATAELNEVIVTATRRRESLQDVPLTVQVLTGATLSRINATTLSDFLSYLPGVTALGVGPGQNDIYIRGLGTGPSGVQAGGFSNSFPNVAIYLDEASVQFPGRNLDLYAADLDRIEVLEGPQGTLFGAGAQAGVLRYITNKPKLDLTEASANAGSAVTAHGAPSTALDAVLNLPVVPEHLAVRALIYDEKRGGYINNLPSTFTRSPHDASIAYAYSSYQVPANSAVLNNAPYVGKDINPVTYQGVRVEVLYQVTPDWQALVTQSYQLLDAEGVSTEMPADSSGNPLPPLSVALFNPSYDKDRFASTALTVHGHAGPLELLYAGSYLTRNVEQLQDYTSYAHGGLYTDYYQCIQKDRPADSPATAQCFSPSSTWRDQEHATHLTQELRWSTPEQWRLRGVGGFYYDDYRIESQVDWFYLTALSYFAPLAPPTGYYELNGQVVCACTPNATFVPGYVTLNNPDVRPPGDAFFNDITREFRQRAVYASFDFDLVPERLILTAGTRYYDVEATERGALGSSFGCSLLYANPSPGRECVNAEEQDLDALKLGKSFVGFRSRANLAWRLSRDALLYYTWSQGFRPGGFNRGIDNNLASPLSTAGAPWQNLAVKNGGWTPPFSYQPDYLTNNEVGWKTTWLEGRLQWNGAVFQENWDHAQVSALDTEVVSGVTLNGSDYRLRGLETSFSARVGPGLSIEGGALWNHSELVHQAQLYWANGVAIDFSQLKTGTGEQLANPFGPPGSPLAGAPGFQGNLRVRYEYPWNGYNTFVQVAGAHQSHSWSTTDRLTLDSQGNSVYYDLPGFTTYDAALGAARGGWTAQLYAENLTDTQADLFTNYHQFYKAITVSRPRTLGLRISWRSAGS